MPTREEGVLQEDEGGFLAFGGDAGYNHNGGAASGARGEGAGEVNNKAWFGSDLSAWDGDVDGNGNASYLNSSTQMLQPLDRVPWFRLSSDPLPDNPLVRLHNEILDFCDLLAPTKAEVAQRHHIIDTVRRTIEGFRGLWSSCEVKVFGSEATKVFLPESDVDMVVLPTGDFNPNRIKNALFRLAEPFQKMKEVTKVEVIAKARIPLLKILFGTLQVDVSFSNDSGLRSARLVIDFMEDLPPLRPLVLLIKYFLAQRELNETYHGGAGSFLVQLMLVAFLQHRRREARSLGHPAANEDNLGALLLGFLRFYGQDLNTEEVGVSVLGEGRFFRKSDRNFVVAQRPFLVCAENPLDPTLDVGKNSYVMDRILSAFRHAYRRLANAAALSATSQQQGRPPLSILSAFLRHDDEVLTARIMPRGRAFRTDVFAALLADVGIRPNLPPPPPPPQQQRYVSNRYDDGPPAPNYHHRPAKRERDDYNHRDYDDGYHRDSYENYDTRDNPEPSRKRGRWSGGRVEQQDYREQYDSHQRGDDGRSRRRHSYEGGGGRWR